MTFGPGGAGKATAIKAPSGFAPPISGFHEAMQQAGWIGGLGPTKAAAPEHPGYR